MTSPYIPLPGNATAQERRPSYEDLKARAEEAGFGGGRGVMDTREWFELCYFYPIEEYLLASLRAKYSYDPDMTDENAAVCVSTWIYDNSVSRADWGSIKDRLLFVDDNLIDYDNYDARRRERIMQEAYKHGFVHSYSFDVDGKPWGPFLGLREDIDNYLDELVWKECVENDNAIIAAHGKEAFDELTTILKKAQERPSPPPPPPRRDTDDDDVLS